MHACVRVCGRVQAREGGTAARPVPEASSFHRFSPRFMTIATITETIQNGVPKSILQQKARRCAHNQRSSCQTARARRTAAAAAADLAIHHHAADHTAIFSTDQTVHPAT